MTNATRGPRRKHIILVHGRSTKPARREKRRLVKRCIVHGLGRVDEQAQERVKSGEVRRLLTLAYYGDINNRILAENKNYTRWLNATDPDHDDAPCEESGSYDESIAKTLARPRSGFTRRAYERYVREVKDYGYMDEVAMGISGIARVLGISDAFVKYGGLDMCEYLYKHEVGARVRQRLEQPLAAALKRDEDVCLIGHSMGCIVVYDVLWKFSRMLEYEHLAQRRVSMWLSIGCPLGEHGVRKNLIDAHVDEDARFPKDILHTWVNIAAHDDFIAHDNSMADDYRHMKRRGYLDRIVDRRPIYTFYEGYRGHNPHKLYAYLDHPKVAREITRWLERE